MITAIIGHDLGFSAPGQDTLPRLRRRCLNLADGSVFRHSAFGVTKGQGSMQGSAPDRAGAIAAPAGQPRRGGVGAVRPELTAETLRLYGRAWTRFSKFCAEYGQAALPAGPDAVAAFLGQPARGRGGLARSLAAIDHRHRQHGFAPPERDANLRAALRSARNARPRVRRNPAPSPAQLQRLARSCPGDLAGRRDRALLLLAAAGLGRAEHAALGTDAVRLIVARRTAALR